MTDKAYTLGTTAIGAALVTLAAVLHCPELAATFAAGISTNLFQNLLDVGLRHGAEGIFRPGDPTNHHLQAALTQSFLSAIDDLRSAWPDYARNEHLDHLTPEATGIFDYLRDDVATLLTTEVMTSLAGSASALRAFQQFVEPPNGPGMRAGPSSPAAGAPVTAPASPGRP